jgi:hypothetical protein
MVVASLFFVLAVQKPDEGLADKMRPLYVREAQAYTLAVESDPETALELRKESVFVWSNPVRSTTQGSLFVWLRDGRPAALACIFSYPHRTLPGRVITHEFHALNSEKLIVKRDSPNEWVPGSGLARKELPGGPAPADTPAGRLVQLRKLAQGFSGHSVDRDGNRWELRLLATPLYRYAAARTGVVDGALFALMSNGGTDPEVLLLIEAREVEGKQHWEYACGRFSDWSLHIRYRDREVFTYVRAEATPLEQRKSQLYRIYPEKVVTPEGKVLARTEPAPGGPKLVPIEDR